MSELKIGARYKRWRRIGAHRAYRMCHVLAKTERGWLIDCGDGPGGRSVRKRLRNWRRCGDGKIDDPR